MAESSGYGTIIANGTAVIKAQDAILHKVIAVNHGTSWIIGVYDAATAATATAGQLRFLRTMASGDILEPNIPMQNGITIINTGTAGTAVIVWKRG